MATLRVETLPNNRLALTNRVYLAPETWQQLSSGEESLFFEKFVSVGLHAYEVDLSSDRVPPGSIAMNGLQRHFCKLHVADLVDVRPVDTRTCSELINVEISVDILTKRKRLAKNNDCTKESQEEQLNTDKLSRAVHSNYRGQFFEPGQKLAMRWDNKRLLELSIITTEPPVSALTTTLSSKDLHAVGGHINADSEMPTIKPTGHLGFHSEICFIKTADSCHHDLIFSGSRVKGSLSMAVRQDSLENVQRIVQARPEALAEKDVDGRTPLLCAFQSQIILPSLEMIQYLTDQYPAAIKVRDDMGYTVLHIACRHKNTQLSVIKLLVEKFPEAVKDKENKSSVLPLHLACWKEEPCVDILQFLVDKYPDALTQKCGYLRMNPLMLACACKAALPAVKILVDAMVVDGGDECSGNDGNERDGVWTPLHYCCERMPGFDTGDISSDVVRLLLQHFPNDLEQQESNGRTPFHVACQHAPPRVVQTMLEECKTCRIKTLLQVKWKQNGLTALKQVEDQIARFLSWLTLLDNQEERDRIQRELDEHIIKRDLMSTIQTVFVTESELSVNEMLQIQSEFERMHWWGGVTLLIKAQPTIVHAMQMDDTILPFVFHNLCRRNNLTAVWRILQSNPSIITAPKPSANKDER